MSVAVEVGLLSGKAVAAQVGSDAEVEALRLQAQTALGVGHGRLVDSSGSILDDSAPIEQSGVQDGDRPTLHMNSDSVQVQASDLAFACHSGRWICRDLGQYWGLGRCSECPIS